jgi:hypothetical protein
MAIPVREFVLNPYSILILNFWLAIKITGTQNICHFNLLTSFRQTAREHLREWVDDDVITGFGRYGERQQRMQSQICFKIFHSLNTQKMQLHKYLNWNQMLFHHV